MKKILILGATSTVAADIARIYAKAGERLYFIARNPEKLQLLLKEFGHSVIGSQVTDFTHLEETNRVLLSAIHEMQEIDIAIIAHGDLGNQSLSETDYKHAIEIFQTNCNSVISMLVPLANVMEKRGFGQLVVISSVAGDRGRPRNYTYGAAKGAINIYLQGIRSRLWKAGVFVHTIKLGPVDTPMTTSHKKNFSFTTSAKAAQGIINAIHAKKAESYVPKFWYFVMFVVRLLPERVFQKLKFLSEP
jgi:decaprenylphospho-beta-D-erythro-pentofuranosid-2-ulose 2-reductase